MDCLNKENCPCAKVECKNHGRCCACTRNHLGSETKPYPACFVLRDGARKA